MKRNTLILTCCALLFASGASAGNTLLFDDFDDSDIATGGTNATNGGFGFFGNGAGGPGSVSESGTVATVSTSKTGINNGCGIASTTSFDLKSFPEVTATLVVTSADDPDHHGINLTLQDGADYYSRADGDPYLRFQFDNADDNTFYIKADDGSSEVTLHSDEFTMSELTDGFSFSVTITETGWSIRTSGLLSVADKSGSWNAMHNRDTLFDNSTHIAGFIQESDTDRTISFDSMRVVVGAPEPSTELVAAEPQAADWTIDSADDWSENLNSAEGLVVEGGTVAPKEKKATVQTKVHKFDARRSAKSLTVTQSPVWQNWNSIENLGPRNLSDAPVLLTVGPDNYWMFGRYWKGGGEPGRKVGEKATLAGFDIPLKTTRFPNQFDAPGGLKPGKGGYHAWQSRDMKNWVHHGPVTETFSKWVTTAEYVDGKVYIYYDFPNDQDPHLYIDDDLTDGMPGKNMGMAFKDPSHGSDCAVIRDLKGRFHVIYEDWGPIDASKHSWDSPLAGHAVSPDGIGKFKILSPAVDERTKPTGKFAEFPHRYWHLDDPKNYPGKPAPVDIPQHRIKKGDITAFARYEIHEPEQSAYGDWAAISIGGQVYLFGDYHPARGHIRVGWFTSSSIDKPFTFCGEIGRGHPDPDIAFAEGQFYLATQQRIDYVSPGPWVEKVEARVGVDKDNDGRIDQWTDWTAIKERYDYIKGFSKQVARTPARLDLAKLPAGFGFQVELRLTDTTENQSRPIIERMTLSFAD